MNLRKNKGVFFKNMKHTIKVKVGGMEYCINSDDDELYVKTLAAELDRRLDTIAKNSPFLSTTMVAVFAALEASDKAKKQQRENDELRMELKRALEDTACAKLEADILRRKVAHYEREAENYD
jgi:cell division protein ZapA (FtsZ GTPase activity inhibitor)